MNVSFDELKRVFKRVLLQLNFSEEKAELCASIFAENSRDGVYSHGLNRFPVFVQAVKDGSINSTAEPQLLHRQGAVEYWDGQLGAGMYNATLAMQRAIVLAHENGIGCVSLKNTNHWMRGGTYGRLAADAGCIGICTSNTIANMPPWGSSTPRLGNNPLIIAIPYKDEHIVLDIAISQFSYGKLQEYELKGQELPVAGGYDEAGKLTTNPAAIRATKRTLPIGFWKGSGLSFVLDVLVTSLSGGNSVQQITAQGKEMGLSQLFICIQAGHLKNSLIEEIIQYTKNDPDNEAVSYPGERIQATRTRNEQEGIPVDEAIWQQVLQL